MPILSRNTEGLINDAEQIMEDIAISEHMEMLWDNYKKSNSYVGDLSWNDVLDTVTNIVLDEIKYDTKYEIENEDDEIEYHQKNGDGNAADGGRIDIADDIYYFQFFVILGVIFCYRNYRADDDTYQKSAFIGCKQAI